MTETQTRTRTGPVLEDLCREVAFEVRDDGPAATDDSLDGNTLVGYGAVFGSPTRSYSLSCRTRSSLLWRSSGISPTSSRKIVPPSAS